MMWRSENFLPYRDSGNENVVRCGCKLDAILLIRIVEEREWKIYCFVAPGNLRRHPPSHDKHFACLPSTRPLCHWLLRLCLSRFCLFWKSKIMFMKSPCYLRVCIPSNNFRMPGPICMKLGTRDHLYGEIHWPFPSVVIA
jgi:hypothetical protein